MVTKNRINIKYLKEHGDSKFSIVVLEDVAIKIVKYMQDKDEDNLLNIFHNLIDVNEEKWDINFNFIESMEIVKEND